ncbi:MAG: hypothetical protein ACRC62_05050 [Microcoleus sp.]
MNNWPTWFPKPNAWMSAILLILLVRGLGVILRIILEFGHSIASLSPKLQFLLYYGALLSPILAIAVVHHWLQIFLDRSFPNTRSPEITISNSIFPGLMSWWEGFYGWMAIALAFIVSSTISVIFLPSPNIVYGMLAWWNELHDLFTLDTLYRLITTAYLYQLENIVRQHLMSVGATTRSH